MSCCGQGENEKLNSSLLLRCCNLLPEQRICAFLRSERRLAGERPQRLREALPDLAQEHREAACGQARTLTHEVVFFQIIVVKVFVEKGGFQAGEAHASGVVVGAG
eukprot:6181484-Pleurochrysis_carterae.AAC.2